MSEENVEIVRKAFDAFTRGDMEGVLGLCDKDIVITQPPDLPGETENAAGWMLKFRHEKLIRFRAFRNPEEALERMGLSE